ncbi:MAG: ATP-binding protein, partial [Syntrophomonadaceae bacterium]
MGSINIFAGGFGSGKTEIALNFAMDNHAETQDVVLADLDLVNPYFVSRHIQAELNAHGVKLMAPEGEL